MLCHVNHVLIKKSLSRKVTTSRETVLLICNYDDAKSVFIVIPSKSVDSISGFEFSMRCSFVVYVVAIFVFGRVLEEKVLS